MQSTWQLQTAKNRFSEVVDAALTQGAQIVTRHGKPLVKVVAHRQQCVLSNVVLPELETGALRAPSVARRNRLLGWIEALRNLTRNLTRNLPNLTGTFAGLRLRLRLSL